MLRQFPGAMCESGDGTAVASLRPAERRAWLAANPLPTDVRYYSLATFPQPERISAVLKSSYRKLARVEHATMASSSSTTRSSPGAS